MAALAAGLQEKEYEDRTPIVRSWDDMASLLPAAWSEKAKLGFLTWLAGPAGLLADRTDALQSFARFRASNFG